MPNCSSGSVLLPTPKVSCWHRELSLNATCKQQNGPKRASVKGGGGHLVRRKDGQMDNQPLYVDIFPWQTAEKIGVIGICHYWRLQNAVRSHIVVLYCTLLFHYCDFFLYRLFACMLRLSFYCFNSTCVIVVSFQMTFFHVPSVYLVIILCNCDVKHITFTELITFAKY